MSGEHGPQTEESKTADWDKAAFPGSLAWIRQITLWQIIKNPGLVKLYPRIFLEKPWLPIVLFSAFGLASTRRVLSAEFNVSFAKHLRLGRGLARGCCSQESVQGASLNTDS
jgi:hypothetical protein